MSAFTPSVRLECGDALDLLRREPSESVHCIVTSPPYWALRDYGCEGQIGLESSPAEYIARLVAVFAEAGRVLRDDGTLWLNLGDSYASGGCGARDSERWPKQSRNDHMATHRKKQSGLKPKDLTGLPWRCAFALQEQGWYLRCDVVWARPNPMPESTTDRPTRAHEYVFLLAKSARYYYDADAIREPYDPASFLRYRSPIQNVEIQNRQPGRERGRENRMMEPNSLGRNARSVWTIPAQPFPQAHFATFPEELARRCVLAGCPAGGTVLDPFVGSGTVCAVAARLGRHSIGFDLNPDYIAMARRRVLPDSQPRLPLGVEA